MKHTYPVAASSLLLLQHQPVIAPALNQALSPLNCQVTATSNGRQFIRHYTESRLNPFQIFGQTTVSCLLLDLLHASRKTLEVLGELRQRFSDLPPVVGLCHPQMARHTSNYLQKGFDDMIVFSAGEGHLQNSLKKYMGGRGSKSGKNPIDTPINVFDHLPVINLKTYALFAELAALQQFPVESLFFSFMDEMDGFVNRLIDHYEQGNSRDCEKLAVSIRSLSGTLGASQLNQTARLLQIKLKEKHWQEAGRWLPYLIEKYLVLKDYMEGMPALAERKPLLA